MPESTCCAACRVPGLEGKACYAPWCRCHWYEDDQTYNGVDEIKANLKKESPKVEPDL